MSLELQDVRINPNGYYNGDKIRAATQTSENQFPTTLDEVIVRLIERIEILEKTKEVV